MNCVVTDPLGLLCSETIPCESGTPTLAQLRTMRDFYSGVTPGAAGHLFKDAWVCLLE